MKIFKSINIYILCVIILPIITFFWFNGNNFIVSGDYMPVFRPIPELINDFYLWLSSDTLSLGANTGNISKIFPYELLIAIGSTIGFSAIELQKIIFYVMFLFSGLSIYFLIYWAFNKIKNVKIAAFIAALFYMFNTYVMFFKVPDRMMSLFPYMLTPFALLLFMKGLEQKRNNWYALLISVVYLLMAPSVTTPTYLILVFSVILLYYFYYSILNLNREAFKHSTLFILKFIFITILLNFWWILPYTHNIILTSKATFNSVTSIESFNDTTLINSIDTSFLNIFRIMGYWALNGSYNGQLYYPIVSKFYSLITIKIISFFLPIIVFMSLLINNKDKTIRNTVLFFSLLAIGSLFMIKGVHSPFSELNKWLFFNIPGFSMFRSQYEKFGAILVLSYSVLFGFVISSIFSWIKDFKGKNMAGIFLVLIFIIFFVINVFPFWTGQNIQNDRGILSSQLVSIPESYGDSYIWLNELFLDKRISIFPLRVNYFGNINVDTKWGEANGNIYAKLLNQPVIINSFFNNTGGSQISLNMLINFFPILNVDYLFIDMNRREPNNTQIKNDINIAVSEKKIKIINEYHNLKYYKLNSSYFLPHFYTPQNIIISNQEINALLETVSADDYEVRSAIIFEEQNPNKTLLLQNIPPINIHTPILEFKRINPTKYRIIVHNATNSFLLVFSERFNDDWKAYNVNYDKEQVNKELLTKYRTLNGNEEDQATKEEIIEFIDNSLIGSLGNGKIKQIKHNKWEDNKEKLDYIENYNINFISKNFQGTIQNDNLNEGKFYETWFMKPFENNKNHLIVNGYANSWLINTLNVCNEKNKCVKNNDGSYDFEIVIEYWPQRLFYIGLFISVITLIGFFAYWYRKKKNII